MFAKKKDKIVLVSGAYPMSQRFPSSPTRINKNY